MIGLAVAAAGCGGGSGPAPSLSGSGPPSLTRCEPLTSPPGSFEQRSTYSVVEGDHVGVRTTLQDDRGRKLVVASGISGEFGEGMPAAGSLRLATGGEAALLGTGRIWTAVWSESPPCSARAVIGHRFDRAGFVRILQRMGVVAPAG